VSLHRNGGGSMTDLTVVILTKNEEKNLRKCVESFRGVAKRFVIVDSFSTDGTEALCKELNTELQKIGSSLDFYQNKWISYADQLNWGLQNTGIDTEWSMRMDADEEIMEDLAAEIDEKLPKVKAPVNGIILRRRVYFMGRWIKHGGRYPELLLRIFRTGKASCEMKIMDEHMILSEGTTVEFKHDLIDNNQKDLEWWTAKHNWYSNREVLDHQMTLENAMDESLEQDGTSSGQAKMKRVVKNSGYYRVPKFFRAHLYFIYRYYIKLGFLDGQEGKIFHFLQAYWYRFLVDAKIYECEKKGTKMKPQGDLEA
jgi:glycosyltransferase involved in cell wall biosynthesis